MKPTLPSVTAAEKLWLGQPGAWPALAWSLAERSAIIAAALLLAGERKHVLKYTAFVAVGIEIVVLLTVKNQLKEE